MNHQLPHLIVGDILQVWYISMPYFFFAYFAECFMQSFSTFFALRCNSASVIPSSPLRDFNSVPSLFPLCMP